MSIPIDFQPSTWLITYYHSIGTLSLVLNAYTLFLIIFKTDKIDSFKYYLLAFQTFCFIIDLHLTLLMQPQPLHPLPAGFCTGLLTYPNLVSHHMLMTSTIGLIGLQFGGLLLCFLKKYLVFRKLKRSSSHEMLANGCFVGFCLGLMFLIAVTYQCGLGCEEEFRIIREKYPSYEEGFRTLSHFALYDLNIYWILLCAGTCTLSSYAAAIFAFTTFNMFHILLDLQRISSSSNFNKQRKALISLVAQLLTTLLGVVPAAGLAFCLLIEFRYAQTATRLFLAVFCTHASVNAVVLVVTTPPFRRFTFFWVTGKRSPVIVSIA
ncbi:unnamed protein product [Caenorhabditis brenneri]